jgi:AraC-like DNA-binding protein
MLVKELGKYKDQANLADDIIFMPKPGDYVFGVLGKYYFNTYFGDRHQVNDVTALYQTIIQLKVPRLLQIKRSPENGTFIYVIPISTISLLLSEKDAFLMFLITEEKLRGRFYAVAGNLNRNIIIVKGGVYLLGNQEDESGHGGNVLISGSSVPYGDDRSSLIVAKDEYMQSIAKLKNMYGWVLVILFLTCFALGLFLAFKNYKPMKLLEDKVDDQSKQLRNNSLNFLLMGLSDTGKMWPRKMGIKTDDMAFCVYLVKPFDGICQEDVFNLCINYIEKYTFQDISSYAVERWAGDAYITIVCGINRNRKGSMREYADHVKKLLNGQKCSVCLSFGGLYDAVERINVSFIEAKVALEYAGEKLKTIVFFEDLKNITLFGIDYPRGDIVFLINCIRLGNFPEAERSLNKINQEHLSGSNASILGRCIGFDVISNVLKLLMEIKMDADPAVLAEVVAFDNASRLYSLMVPLILDLCEHIKGTIESKKNDTSMQILEYIDKNYRDCNIGLKSLSDKFFVSINVISKIIMKEKGVLFHDYLFELRIKEAMRLLSETDGSVQEICKQVGYTNVSHFIKNFRAYTGMTPAKYRGIK